MAGEVTTLTGKSGTQYQFTIYPRLSRFTPKGGVYVMGRGAGDNMFAFCFVGHTADFSVRPFAPEKTVCFDNFRADHIFILDETDAGRRAQITQDLIQGYAPRCNTV